MSKGSRARPCISYDGFVPRKPRTFNIDQLRLDDDGINGTIRAPASRGLVVGQTVLYRDEHADHYETVVVSLHGSRARVRVGDPVDVEQPGPQTHADGFGSDPF